MRIISGKYKARRIEPPSNLSARPTTDFAKEALFNLLNNRLDFENLRALDLFAGTGSISYELISRGATSVTAVELAHQQQNFIITTAKKLDMHGLNLFRGDVFKYLNALKIETEAARYDFIFADPPYTLETLPTLPDIIFSKQLLREDGIFVLEHSAAHDFSQHPHFQEHRQYGAVNFTFFQP